MRSFVVFGLAAICSACSFPQKSNQPGLYAEIVRSGVYTGRDSCQSVSAPQLATGHMTYCGFSGFQARKTVEKNADHAFGFDYVVKGLEIGKCYVLTHSVQHPPFAPPGQKTITSQSRDFRVCGSKANAGEFHEDYLWSFDEEWEKAPGKWTLTLSYQGHALANDTYLVY